jgi:hypothetical protein
MEAFIPVVWVAFMALVLVASHLSRRSQETQLDQFRRALEGGHGRTAVSWLGGLQGAFVKGHLDGRPVSLTFERRGSGKNKYHVAVYEVQVDNPVADFTAEDEGVLDGLWRWMGASSSKVVGQGVKLTGANAGTASKLFQRSDLLAVVRRLLELPGEQRGVRLQGRRLRLERRASGGVVDAADLERTFRSLLRAAALCGREQVELPKIRLRPKVGTFAWTGGGAAALCPYCRDGLAADGDGAAACDRCGTAHHAACLEEAGGCTVFGCDGGREARPVRA